MEKKIVDKNGKIIVQDSILKILFSFIKNNVACIGVMSPMLIGILANLLDYYHYVGKQGYYTYFHIDSTLMLPYNKMNLYQNITVFVCIIVYWIFNIFSVRVFLKKRNYLKKIVVIIIIPVIFFMIILWNGRWEWKYILQCSISLVIYWWMMYPIGYCLAIPFHSSLSYDENEKKYSKKHLKKMGIKDYKIIGSVLIALGVILLIGEAYFGNYNVAKEKKLFGIVEIEGQRYAVIDINQDKMILQKCKKNFKTLEIYCDTYLRTKNDKSIMFYTFDTVKLKCKHKIN